MHDRLPYRRKRKLLEVGSGVGLRDVVTGVKTMHLDNREPVERAETLAYWSDLLLSGKELARAARDPNCVFFYAFIQARARAW